MNFPIKCHWSLYGLTLKVYIFGYNELVFLIVHRLIVSSETYIFCMQIYWSHSKRGEERDGDKTTPCPLNFIIYGPSKLPIFSLFIFFPFLSLSSIRWTSKAYNEKASTEKRPKSAFLCKLIQATSSTFNIKVNVEKCVSFSRCLWIQITFFTFLLLCCPNCVNWNSKNLCRVFNGRKNSFVMHVIRRWNGWQWTYLESCFMAAGYKRFSSKLNQDFEVGT